MDFVHRSKGVWSPALFRWCVIIAKCEAMTGLSDQIENGFIRNRRSGGERDLNYARNSAAHLGKCRERSRRTAWLAVPRHHICGEAGRWWS
jgi:hypothetical protein